MTTLAFIMDPMERIRPQQDTTFAFMLAAQERGHRVLHVNPRDVAFSGSQVWLSGSVLSLMDAPAEHFTVRERCALRAADCSAIFIRTDPPFDEDYLTVTWLLSFAEAKGVRVINSPRGLRDANEHLYSLYFPDLCPETLVTSDRIEIDRFVREIGTAVAKPINGHGGFGVVRLIAADTNMAALVDMLTLEGKRPVMVQRYLEEGLAGDKRLLLVDGELRGAVRRVPRVGDHRGNVHVGGRVERCTASASDERIVAALRDRLRADGLFFVGIDVIGDFLIEVNVTSPTLVRELKRLGGNDVAAEVIQAVSA